MKNQLPLILQGIIVKELIYLVGLGSISPHEIHCFSCIGAINKHEIRVLLTLYWLCPLQGST
ncbi:hypothetical protein D3C72_2191280 [compost metagenome]